MVNKQVSAKDVFDRALEIGSPEQRAAYVLDACADDCILKQEVDQLLRAYEEAESFLESPPPGIADTVDGPSIAEGPGTIIGRYKLLQQIGEGGMGVVYMAERLRPIEQRVALKIIKPGMDSRQVIARFEAERQALAMMDHPNIAKVLDAGTTDSGRPYFVMELVRGVPITEYCNQQHLAPRARLKLFAAVCRAVQHAHQKGIIHRDLKPSNVLVAHYDNDPVPKVIDFGVAKATGKRLTDKTLFTRFDQIVGTLEYMSPEQVRFNQRDIDTRTDIYSLGVVLYELLTGVTPFESKRLHSAAIDELVRIIRDEEPPKPSTRLSSSAGAMSMTAEQCSIEPRKLASLLRGDLDWLVMKALDKERDRRYESAASMAADIDRYLAGDPIEARPPSPTYKLRKTMSRHRAVFMMVGIVVLALVTATVTSTWFAVDAIRQRTIALENSEKFEASLRELSSELYSKFLAAVMSGNAEKSQAAIAQAKDAKLPPSWINILKGQRALYSGRTADAIKLLEREKRSSVAAHSMLVVALRLDGDFEKASLELRRLRGKKCETPQDYLFRAQAERTVDADRGVKLARRAIAMKDSPLARAVLAEPLTCLASKKRDVELIKMALHETTVARAFLGDTPYVLALDIYSHHVAFKIGYLSNAEDYVGEVRTRCQELRNYPIGRAVLAWFFMDMDDQEYAERVWSWKTRKSDQEMSVYIPWLLGRKTPCEVIKELDNTPAAGPYGEWGRASVLAMIPQRRGEAQRLCEEQLRRDTTDDVHTCFLWTLCLLGRTDIARKESIRLLDSSKDEGWGARLTMRHMAGRIDTQTLVNGANKMLSQSGRPSGTYYYLGLRALADGNQAEAKDYFEKLIENGIFTWDAYWWAKRMLTIMEDNPAWLESDKPGANTSN